jgi:hypothetical protein
MSRPALVATILLFALLASCWAKFPDERFKHYPPEVGVDQAIYPDTQPPLEATVSETGPVDRRVTEALPDRHVGDLYKCTPGGQLSCTSDNKGLIKCNASGWGTVTVDCTPNHCQDSLRRCDGCNPFGKYPVCSSDGKDLVTGCTLDGIPQKTNCPKGCSVRDGGAAAACQ